MNRAAGYGLESFAHADFDGGKVVVAATESEAFARERWVGLCEEVQDLGGRHGGLVVEGGEFGGNGYALYGLTGEFEEDIGAEAGAGAVGLPLVAEKAGVGIDVVVG